MIRITEYQNPMDIPTFFVTVTCIFVPFFKVCIAVDSIRLLQSISYGQQTLVSQGGRFELGFFTPGNSNKTYLGIWYKNIPIQRVVWVANRVNPVNGSNGILTVNSTGSLVLSHNGTVVWYTTPQKTAQNPVAVLLDNGNFVVRNEGEANLEDYLWQSFDHPSDTLLPGMKLGTNLRNSQAWQLTSWNSPVDPSPGVVSLGVVLHAYPEYVMMKGTEKFYRQGPYNGLHLSGVPAQQPTDSFLNSEIVKNKDEIYYTYILNNNSVISYVVLNQTTLVQYVWHEEYHDWKTYYSVPRDNCDKYGLCGAYGNCMISQGQVCQCLNGFSPKSPQAWITSDWTQGCVRDEPLSCNDTHKDGFVKFEGLKVPDTTHTWLDETMELEECRDKCLNNCSCMAYANSNISGAGSGCVMWFGDLIDMRQFEYGGQVLYIRIVAGPELDSHDKRVTKIIATTVAAISGVLIFCIYVIYRVRRKIADKSKIQDNIEIHLDELDLPLFDLLTITTATHNFSLNNKIGQGGFGPVYKGKFVDGQEIAVKRLSSSSGQGISEFLTEVKLIAKLQHRNLVKLLGCCIRGEEKMLVYEFMANGSLDSFIFDQIKGKLLEWPLRFNIIFGVARGILYLHHDSRLRIIHRDLKASNVLLDDKLNPKISDFGMARSCGGDQIEGNTNRIVGTYGYMAPEYAVDGLFSIKSDVFSFGILLLEIICGNKNRALCHRNQTLNLVGYAWTLWKEGNTLQLIDSRIKDSCVVLEVLRCIHVSLLCVQQYPEDRPTMTSVVQMLGSEKELADPKEPGFFPRNVSDGGNSSSNKNEMSTNDELTVTSLNGR